MALGWEQKMENKRCSQCVGIQEEGRERGGRRKKERVDRMRDAKI